MEKSLLVISKFFLPFSFTIFKKNRLASLYLSGQVWWWRKLRDDPLFTFLILKYILTIF